MPAQKIIYSLPSGGSFLIPNVEENGKIYTAKVMENLTTESMNYEQMQEFDAKARKAGNPRLISIPMFFQLAKKGMQQGNNNFLNSLNENLKKWFSFFSAVNYSSLNEEEKQDRRERLRELSHIEQLWD